MVTYKARARLQQGEKSKNKANADTLGSTLSTLNISQTDN